MEVLAGELFRLVTVITVFTTVAIASKEEFTKILCKIDGLVLVGGVSLFGLLFSLPLLLDFMLLIE